MDNSGELLIGVNVLEVGTTNGTITDINGTYIIVSKTDKPKLKFTYIGFDEQEVSVGSSGILDITLNESVESLDEVVVVGFGTQKKASVIGSITNIEPTELQRVPSRSLSNNLAGAIPGVIAVQRSGDPWHNNAEFWIRGISTFAGNKYPLVLVDGVERSLNDMDPEEIESFSVLKDASASAVYGVRGANGVIMITTKRGEIGKPKVNVGFEYANTSPVQLPKYVGSVKYLELMNEVYTDAGKPPMVSDEILELYRNQSDPELYPDINWWKVIAKNHATNMRTTANISGGTEKLRYALTLSYFDEDGIIKRDKKQEWNSELRVKRYTVRSNVDVNLTPTTLFRINIGGFLQTRNAPPGDETNFGLFYQASRIPPHVHPPIYSTGEIPRINFRENPWAWATQRGYERLNRNKIESLTSLEQDLKFITPGLKAKVTFSFDKFSGNSVKRAKNPDYYNPASGRDENGNLILTILSHGQEFLGHEKGSLWGDQSIYLETMISYNRLFKSVHDIGAMFLYNQRDFDNGSTLPFRNQGMAGRLSYTYDRRYIAEFNFGYNGSENFAKGKRFGFFPAVALGWIATQEKFMEPYLGVLSNMKIRGSWGQVGNSDIQGRRFAYLSTIEASGEYWWGTENNIYRLGRTEGEVGVPDLTWETVTKMNLGIDLELFNQLSLTFDVFKEKRKDIFMQRRNIPGSAGFNRPIWANFGKVDNQGFEASLNYNKRITPDLDVTLVGNYTYAHNKIKEIDEPLSIQGTYRSELNKPVGQIFGLIAERLFTEDDFDDEGHLKSDIPVQKFSSVVRPGDIKYKDMNGDGEINALDRTAVGGTRTPEVVYGFGSTVRYKEFDFGVFFQGTGNLWQMLGGENWLPGTALGATGNIFTNIDNRWTKDNPSSDVFWPRLSYGANANNEQASTWWLKRMNFLRLKNIEIGYSLPKAITKNTFISKCRFFVRGSNLLTFSSFKMWDPELQTTDGLKYPITKSFSLGLTIDFK